MNQTILILRKIYIPIFACVLITAGCGGGGGGTSSEVAEDIAPAKQSPTAKASSAKELRNLEIAPINDLSPATELTVRIQTGSEAAYLSICPNRQESDFSMTMKYDDCLIRMPVSAGESEISVRIANHVSSLLAVIWHQNSSQQPSLHSWKKEMINSDFAELNWLIVE